MGGSFDPIHYGHLLAAEEVRAVLHLEEVLFIPAAISPFKMGRASTDTEHRFRMVELAIATNPFFRASRIEIDRPPPSYTVDTLRLLRANHRPEDELYFIIGQDAVRDIPLWKEPEEIVRLAHLAVVTRPGTDFRAEQIVSWLPQSSPRIEIVPIPLLDISSTDIRARVASGRPIKYLTPEAVERYILEHGLYRHGEVTSFKEIKR